VQKYVELHAPKRRSATWNSARPESDGTNTDS
jgi:hypothetical protein